MTLVVSEASTINLLKVGVVEEFYFNSTYMFHVLTPSALR